MGKPQQRNVLPHLAGIVDYIDEYFYYSLYLGVHQLNNSGRSGLHSILPAQLYSEKRIYRMYMKKHMIPTRYTDKDNSD